MRQRTIHVVQLATCMLIAGSLFTISLRAASEAPSTVPTTDEAAQNKAMLDERIQFADRTFNELLATSPLQDVAVTASFSHPRSIAETIQHAADLGLTIEGFQHGDASHSGGYTMRRGERVEDVVGQYERDAQFFTQRDLEFTEQMLEEADDPAMKEALARRRTEVIQRQKQLSDDGLLIVGIDLRGSAHELQTFRKAHSYVRVLEVRDANRRNAAIPPAE